MTIEELKNTTFRWKFINNWPSFKGIFNDCDMVRVVQFEDIPKSGEELSEEWTRFFIDQRVELECFGEGAHWVKVKFIVIYNGRCKYRIPLPEPKMRNKTPDELPYEITVFLPHGSFFNAISKHRDSIFTISDQKWIDGLARNGFSYTTDGIDRQSFQVEVKEGNEKI